MPCAPVFNYGYKKKKLKLEKLMKITVHSFQYNSYYVILSRKILMRRKLFKIKILSGVLQ